MTGTAPMKRCRFCGSRDLINLISYKNYPIFIGCSDEPSSMDELYNYEIWLCTGCAIIQQIDPPPLEILYKENRAFGIGRTWQNHYKSFLKFLQPDIDQSDCILEVGGGNGILLRMIRDYNQKVTIYDIEPNPFYEIADVTTIQQYFNRHFQIDRDFNLIYCSHLVEHLSDVNEFLSKSNALLPPGGILVTACPNILKSFEHLHLNAFTTDHLNYFTPDTLSDLALKHGFRLNDFFQYQDHGMYMRFEKMDQPQPTVKPGNSKQAESILSAFNEYDTMIEAYAEQINSTLKSDYYLFGGHGLTISFLRYLADPGRVIAILDNEPTKKDRRLTGTEFYVRHPSKISEVAEPVVLIYMGAYTTEICQQLLEINPTVNLIRLDKFAASHD